jgi:hypothetical protein
MTTQQNVPANGVVTNAAAPTTDFTVKAGLAQMMKGGVIMDVVNAEQVLILLFNCYEKQVILTGLPPRLGSHRRGSRRMCCYGPRACAS